MILFNNVSIGIQDYNCPIHSTWVIFLRVVMIYWLYINIGYNTPFFNFDVQNKGYRGRKNNPNEHIRIFIEILIL